MVISRAFLKGFFVTLAILLTLALIAGLLAWFPMVLVGLCVAGFFLISLADYGDFRARLYRRLK